MKVTKENRSQINIAIGGFLLFALTISAAENKTTSNITEGEILPSQTKGNGDESVMTRNSPEQHLVLKTDPMTGQVQFNTKTVDISVLNRQKDRENAEKIAIIQKDLQSRIKVTDSNPEIQPTEKLKEISTEDPIEVLRKQVKVKEDLESRIIVDRIRDENKRLRVESEEYYEDYKNPIKRSDVEYYDDEPISSESKPISLAQRMPTEAPKEEDSFFSIFESLFGSSDDESQNKKNQVKEKEPDDFHLKENIKTVGDILKPIKTHDEIQTKSTYGEYDDPQEYRIINEYPQKQGFRPSEQRPHHQYPYQRPNSAKPYKQYRPYPTPGYEDYDLEEFAVNNNDKFTTEKHLISKATSMLTTTKVYSSTHRPTNPVAEKKSDYIGKTSQASNVEKLTEKVPFFSIKPSTENQQPKRSEIETNVNEIKPEKIQDSANFYNLINLPVRYSTKDTAIPLISTSYANTKIQGMAAHKYEKTNTGKYPNHKYEPVSNSRPTISTSTTRRPTYWSARRTTTQPTVTTSRPTRVTTSVTHVPVEGPDFSNVDYDGLAIGSSANFGGYGNKAGATRITETKIPLNKYRETTTRRVYDTQKNKEVNNQDFIKYSEQAEKETSTFRTTERVTPKPVKDVYDEYEYESFPAVVEEVKPMKESSTKYNSYSDRNKVQEAQSEVILQKQPNKTTSTTESIEYEYYDYETDVPITPSTTTTSTPKYRVKYPGLQKEKIKTTTEKVAVIVPSNIQNYFVEDVREKVSTTAGPTSTKWVPPRTTTTTTTTTTPTTTTSTTTTTRKPTTTTTTREPIQSQETKNLQETYTHYYRPKEPAPVFEESDETDEYTPRPIAIHVTRSTTEKPTTPVKPIIVTATKDHENNVNIVLVPMKEPQKDPQRPHEIKHKTEQPTIVHNSYNRPNDIHHQNFDYTTEFTIGAVHGHGGNIPVQGHFVASSISANPYDDDEPFRPIPKPPGLTTSFQVVADQDDIRKPPLEIQTAYPEKRPPSQFHIEENDPVHEPHEFIPSPQFHRPGDTKITNTIQTGVSPISADYDFDGIQTEPKPGQYVMFSKPQLNPELSEGQLKKKAEQPLSKVQNNHHYQETVKTAAESQKQVVFSVKPGQYYTSASEARPSTSEKPDQKRPNYSVPSELLDERLSLQLVPPKEQTEKPFEGNFVTPEYEKVESAANYPRPHWEKNGKPTFLLNPLANKNELNGNRPLSLPPQMAPTLIPPSSAIPQRFRKPLPPHMPPIRKNFNEGGVNTKPKPNLPNILPQFRPNAKIGTGQYQRPFLRPPGYMNSNRRNGPNRYHEKDGNFPYHIHHPSEKDGGPIHREFELEQDIYPKFITKRGKIPAELLDPHSIHKRYGGGPANTSTRRTYQLNQNNPTPHRRLQRTPVTTLQMLQQTPGVKTHKNPVLREDGENPSVPMIPPVYQPYKDSPSTEKNVHVVYPSNINKFRYPTNSEHNNFDAFNYDFTKTEVQYPLLNPTRRNNQEKVRNEFPYGFVKPDDKLKLIRRYPEKDETAVKKNMKVPTDEREIKPNLQDYTPTVTKTQIPSSETKNEKIDMNLHMQSNNQWNKVNVPEDDLIITQNPLDGFSIKKEEQGSDTKTKAEGESGTFRVNPPSEYHTSIKNENSSAFTLGAVMHTIPEGNKKGQVTSVSLGDDLTIRNLDVNQRISNGKIVTVSMPLDVKEDPKEDQANYNFQAPFQASSSLVSKGGESTNQGWSIVQSGETDAEDGQKVDTNGKRNSTKFNFENFKPELIGGFKPIYEFPEEEAEPVTKKQEVKR